MSQPSSIFVARKIKQKLRRKFSEFFFGTPFSYSQSNINIHGQTQSYRHTQKYIVPHSQTYSYIVIHGHTQSNIVIKSQAQTFIVIHSLIQSYIVTHSQTYAYIVIRGAQVQVHSPEVKFPGKESEGCTKSGQPGLVMDYRELTQ